MSNIETNFGKKKAQNDPKKIKIKNKNRAIPTNKSCQSICIDLKLKVVILYKRTKKTKFYV